jgi:hypothetical protein
MVWIVVANRYLKSYFVIPNFALALQFCISYNDMLPLYQDLKIKKKDQVMSAYDSHLVFQFMNFWIFDDFLLLSF